jgi:hypothetical protein
MPLHQDFTDLNALPYKEVSHALIGSLSKLLTRHGDEQ